MRSKLLTSVVGGLMVAAWSVVAAPGVAGAHAVVALHGADADVEVVSATPEASGTRFEVRVTYENDGEPVGSATVTAVATDPSGVAGAPVTFTYVDDGRYSGLVPMVDGTSKVLITADEPEGEVEVDQAFTAPATTAPMTEAPTTDASTTEAPTTGAPATDGASVSRTDEPTTATDDDDGYAAVPLAIGAVVVAAAVGALVWRSRRAAGD